MTVWISLHFFFFLPHSCWVGVYVVFMRRTFRFDTLWINLFRSCHETTTLNVKFIMGHNFLILMDVLVVERGKKLTAEYNDNKKAQIHAGFRRGKGLMGYERSLKFMYFLYNYFLCLPSGSFHLILSQFFFFCSQLSLTVYEILLIAH